MNSQTPKSREIKRLTTPLTFENSRAYDSEGNLLKCSETLSDVRFTIEPKDNFLNDNEILQYAPESKSASKIRLKRGFGSIWDVLAIHESLPWILALYYTVLLSIAIPVTYEKHIFGMYLILVLFIIPLIYLFFVFNLKRYAKNNVSDLKAPKKETKPDNVVEAPVKESAGLDSLRMYEKEVNNLKVLFGVKEKVVRELIEKRFQPPQITYDRFISGVDSYDKLFNAQADAASNIIKLAAEDTPRVREEIQNKIDAMKRIIDQIEDLTNELVINISSTGESTEEVKNLLDDMENLIDSVKDY